MIDASRIPVIVGVGEVVDRPERLGDALDPLALMATAAHCAEDDAGARLLARVDSLDVVHQVSWRYERTAAQLCERLGIAPRRAVYGVTGGESPVRYIHEAALRIARGESGTALVCGGEAQHALGRAKPAPDELGWPLPATSIENRMDIDGVIDPLARRHGLVRPIDVYPLYESAASSSWGQTPAEAVAETGVVWSDFASVAAANPYAWTATPYTEDEITTPSADNRLIAWPYTKRMVANPNVNQGAAVLLTSLARARALGMAEHRVVFVWGGAAANAPRDYLRRDTYAASAHQEAVLARALAQVRHRGGGLGGQGFDLHELYSCFPCVPKMARRTLGLAEDAALTVTGGLSFFGAPLNDYMTHAACAMVRALRARPGATGLLYSQGEYVTKHHALIVASVPCAEPLDPDYSVQAEADTRQTAVPPLDPGYQGPAIVEASTVVYGSGNVASFGVVVARTPGGHRTIGRVLSGDLDGLAVLTDLHCSPVGLSGRVAHAPGDEPASWRFQ